MRKSKIVDDKWLYLGCHYFGVFHKSRKLNSCLCLSIIASTTPLMVLLVWIMRPQCVQYISPCTGSIRMSWCLHSGHDVFTCLKLVCFMLPHIHNIVRTFRKFVVLFFRFRFVLFRFLFRCRGWVLVLWSVCLFFYGLLCFCFCGSFCSPILFFVLCVLFVHSLCCSIFGGCGVWCMVFRSRHISL